MNSNRFRAGRIRERSGIWVSIARASLVLGFAQGFVYGKKFISMWGLGLWRIRIRKRSMRRRWRKGGDFWGRFQFEPQMKENIQHRIPMRSGNIEHRTLNIERRSEALE